MIEVRRTAEHDPFIFEVPDLILSNLPNFAVSVIRYCTLHAIIASGRVRLATDGGAKIAR
jgi:hypothetical protein